jgi:hypothetical protein
MRVRVWPALVFLPLVVAAGGCRDHLFEHESDIVVVNQSSCTLTVFVDGWEAFTVRNESTRTVDNVGSGRHVLEAKDGMGQLVERRYIELHSGEDYYWRLEACPPADGHRPTR